MKKPIPYKLLASVPARLLLACAAAMLLLVGCADDPPTKSGNNGANNGGTVNNGNNGTGGNNGTANNGSNNGNNGTANNGGGTDIWAADYDQSCAFDGDCVVVHEGDACLCGGSACGNTAINQTQQAQWNSDREALCAPEDQVCTAAPCEVLAPACVESTCTSRTPVFVDATNWDKTCGSDADCIIVHEGDPCSACVCGGTAVNAAEQAKYDAAVAGVECTPGPDFCDCAITDSAWCNAGTCEPGVDPLCVGISPEGFFANCDACGANCDSIQGQTAQGNACGCSTSADCPCGLRCGDFEIAPNVSVSGICVR